MNVFIPPYDLEALKEGYKFKLKIHLKPAMIQKIESLFEKYPQIVAYIDGACR